jgi:hypothetical protein
MKCRTQPCETCPYRRDVPSGIWAAHEYAKLPHYDKPTSMQPPEIFHCHTSPQFVCTGWAQCHIVNNPRGHELIALRLAIAFGHELVIPYTDIPFFKSGAEAAAHGMRDIEAPGLRARRAVQKVKAMRKRRMNRKTRKECA